MPAIPEPGPRPMEVALLIYLGFFALSLALLVFSADKFVGGSEELGLALGVPHFIMGITVLAIGTSFPELITALFAVHDGNSELVIGTVVGSNIANILFILGVTAIFSRNFFITWDLLHGDLPMLFGSLFMLAFVVYPLSALDLAQFRQVHAAVAAGASQSLGAAAGVNWKESLLLLAGYALYLHYYSIRHREEVAKDAGELAVERPAFRAMSVVWIGLGLIGVLIGAKYTVQYAVLLAQALGLGNEVVAASMIALGTSMPELVVSISASRRGNFELALGNITGSNIFNTFVVLGVPALLSPLLGDHLPVRVGDPSVLLLQMPFYAAALLLFMVVILDKTLTRTEGWVIFLAYVLFICKLFSIV
jgi:cation:H+ antiporter